MFFLRLQLGCRWFGVARPRARGNGWLVLLVWIVMCGRVGITGLLRRFVRKNDFLDGFSVALKQISAGTN